MCVLAPCLPQALLSGCWWGWGRPVGQGLAPGSGHWGSGSQGSGPGSNRPEVGCWQVVGTSGEGLLFFWDLVPILTIWVAEPVTWGPVLERRGGRGGHPAPAP